MLKENTIFGVKDKTNIAIERLLKYEPKEGYYLAFSGGKDSVVIYDLALKAGVNFDAHYNITTVDPPELVKFIKKEYPQVKRHQPEKTMWKLIVENGMPPLRWMRYCCRILKERGGDGRVVISGIRAGESSRRAKRDEHEIISGDCYSRGKTMVNPIIDWTEQEVWEYIKQNSVSYCSLYNEGWKRLGCVCCPNANQIKQAERWPKIANAYKRACVKALEKAKSEGKKRTWKSGEEMFEWWISGQPGNKNLKMQERLFD